MNPEIQKVIDEIYRLRQGQPAPVSNALNQAAAALLHAGQRMDPAALQRLMPRIETKEPQSTLDRPEGIEVVTPSGPSPVQEAAPAFDWRNL